jgi:regulator of protease activity HflC (stomatin/prohibitin superfamily)
MNKEEVFTQYNGWLALIWLCFISLLSLFFLLVGVGGEYAYIILVSPLVFVISLFCLARGLFTVEPNQGVVLLLFGKYKGTERTTGLRWTNPFYEKRKISLRVRNFDSDKLKVNDKNGNPIEISAVVVWLVRDTAQAVFDVDNFDDYVHVQTESAVRHIATSYPYDTNRDGEASLRTSIHRISEDLRSQIQERVNAAGVEIREARINHLAYAPEIASAMLQRQQAEAVLAARRQIVLGAVSMVQMALR